MHSCAFDTFHEKLSPDHKKILVNSSWFYKTIYGADGSQKMVMGLSVPHNIRRLLKPYSQSPDIMRYIVKQSSLLCEEIQNIASFCLAQTIKKMDI